MSSQLTADMFFSKLFPEEGAATCFTSKLQGVEVYPVSQRPAGMQRFTINCLHPTENKKPDKPAHIPRRANINVVVYRNILVEIDSVSKEEQLEWALRTKFPFTTAVDSGGKSIHFIISLDHPLKNEHSYKRLVKRVHEACLVSGIVTDGQASAPSQLSRCPNVKRIDINEKTHEVRERGMQTLLVVKDYVSLKDLRAWIFAYKPKERISKRRYRDVNIQRTKFLSIATRKLIDNCEYEGTSRHAAFQRAVVQMRKAGYDPEEIEAMLEPIALILVPERPSEIRDLVKWASVNIHPEEK